MKKIGLIGGMSWESSQVYYKILNELVRDRLGGFHSCKCLMESVDFAEIEALQHKDDWNRLNEMMAQAAKTLKKGGADLIILGTNTMHLCAPEIEAATDIPFLHIAQATGERIAGQGLKKVLLLGTRFTMESDFYQKTLNQGFGLETVVPNAEDRLKVHEIIYRELVQGKIVSTSREAIQGIVERNLDEGIEGVILGCTEIPLLIGPDDLSLPIFDTTRIHAEAAVDWALRI